MTIGSFVLVGVMILSIVLLIGIDDIHQKSEVLAEELTQSRQYRETLADRMRDEEDNSQLLMSFADKGQIRIALPENVSSDMIEYNEDVMKRTYKIVIPDVSSDYFDKNPIVGSVEKIDDFDAYEENGGAYFDFMLNDIYAITPTVGDGYLYIDFKNPHEVYDKVVVIDAGHGGRDVGAVEGNNYEKTIDLDIALMLKDIIDADPTIKAYYTRLDDSNPTLEERVKLANTVRADAFLSIHNNSISGFGASSTSGTQVLYYSSDPTRLSERFAEICLRNLCTTLNSKDRGLVNGDDIYIIHNSKSPVALVEIGFLSHPEDLAKLNRKEYQLRSARALYDSIKEM